MSSPRFPLSLVVALFCLTSAFGQIVLKPKGQEAEQLRVEAIKADVAVEAQIATTNLEITFQNTLAQRIEADFIYTLPKNTLVTGFAYWYGDERVVARVVEKERAAAIYSHITTRMRDPALIELVGKRTFRARIFPVMPNADLKVEMTLVQVLPSNGRSYSYTLPLRTEKGHYLDSLDLSLKVAPDASIQDITNNLGLSGGSEAQSWTLSAKSYRPQRDLRLTVSLKPRPLQASLYSARSGGRDGFFALTLTPSAAVKTPKLTIEGVKIYDLRPSRLPSLKANQSFTVYGRYSGADAARITLAGRSAEVWFADRAVPNNSATKLWAAAEIDRLSGSTKNKAQVVALSIRYTIPSKFTSWLAVPKEEMERYRREIVLADMAIVAKQLGVEIRRGKENSALAQSLLARLQGLAKKINEDSSEWLAWEISDQVRVEAWTLAEEVAEGRANGAKAKAARSKLARYRKLSESTVSDQLHQAYYAKADNVVRALASEVLAHRSTGAKAQQLRNQLAVVTKEGGVDSRQLMTNHLYNPTEQIAQKIVAEEYALRPNAETLQKLRTELARLSKEADRSSDGMYNSARQTYLYRQVSATTAKLAQEIKEGRKNGATAESYRAELRRFSADLKKVGGASDYQMMVQYVHYETHPLLEEYIVEVAAGRGQEPKAQAARNRFEEIAKEFEFDAKQALIDHVKANNSYRASNYAFEKRKTMPDREEIARLEAELTRISDAIGIPRDDLTATYESYYEHDQEEKTRFDLILERRKQNPDMALIKKLETRLSEITAERRSRDYAKDRIERIALEVELDKLQNQTLSPEDQSHKDKMQRRQQELRARMGDPLIAIDAPADAMQVVAIMPDGVVKQLEFNSSTKRWEARFDIPTYAEEGEYVVRVIVVQKTGVRQERTMRFHVDTTAPTVEGKAIWVDGKLRLEAVAATDTDRVEAILPWGEMVKLERTGKGGTFFLVVDAPAAEYGRTLDVQFIATDKAHNRTSLKITAKSP